MTTSDWNGVVPLPDCMRERHESCGKEESRICRLREGTQNCVQRIFMFEFVSSERRRPSDDICYKSCQAFAAEEKIPKTKRKPSITASSPIILGLVQ